ncbi:MAG TPA: acyl-CoA dehydrogenase family protein [Rhodopila sp.]|nr:acyl-CoA dehydrogenase family protein [Rhodopila sp.]
MSQTEQIGEMLRDSADRLFRAHCDTGIRRAADSGAWQAGLWSAIEEAGLHRALVPEAGGGFGVPVADAMTLPRVAAAHAVPAPLAETMLAAWLLAEAGLDIPEGPLGLAPVHPRETVSLRRTSDGWHAAGTVTRVPWGRDVEHLVLLDALDGGWAVALVGKSGFTVVEHGENVAREPRDTVRLDGPLVAAAPVALTADTLRLAGAALRTQQIAGALGQLSAMTVQYAQDRVQFGRPLGKFQAVQQNLAVLAGHAAAAVAAADLAAEAFGSGMSMLPIAAGKARAGEAAGIAAAIAHQVHGAIGFTFEHDLHFYTRRLWSWRDEFGNETAWNRVIGRQMALTGADSLWASITAA